MTRKNKALTALSAAAALLLTGCTQQAPEPLPTQAASTTPTPTPTVNFEPYEAEAPKDEATALKDAEATYQQFLDMRGEIYTHPSDTTGLENIATGTALSEALEEYEGIAKAGATVTGRFQFELDPDTSYSAPSANGKGEKIEHGTVTLMGCGDGSQLKIVNKDGTEHTGEGQRVRVKVVVVYSIDTGRWLVNTEDFLKGETC